MNELKIHDIKNLVEIPDISFYIFLILCILAGLIILALLFFIYKFFKNRKNNRRKEYFQILKDLDFTNSKHTAYTITKYSRLLVSNEREEKLCLELIEELEQYKYKKDVNNLSVEAKSMFERFMDSLDV